MVIREDVEGEVVEKVGDKGVEVRGDDGGRGVRGWLWRMGRWGWWEGWCTGR